MSRKGENIYKRKDGRWEGRYIKARTEKGKALYGYVYGKTYKETKQKRQFKIAAVSENKPIKTTTDELSFLTVTQNWLSSIQPQVKQSTFNKYRNLIYSYILPSLENISFSELTVDIIRDYCNYLLKSGGVRHQGLSTKTVGETLSLLRRIIVFANSSGITIACTGKEFSIKQTSKEMSVLCRSEQETLCKYLIHNLSERNAGILLCLFTGLRVGELCALKWDDISLTDGTIYIHQIIQRIQVEGDKNRKTAVVITTPKSKCSIRTIPIPGNIIQVLKQPTISHQGFLVTGTDRIHLEPRTMQNHFKRVLEKASLQPVNFHTLRHTFATRCVEVGFDIKSLSEILGHASVTITMNRYVHPSMELKKKNMQRLSSLFAVG